MPPDAAPAGPRERMEAYEAITRATTMPSPVLPLLRMPGSVATHLFGRAQLMTLLPAAAGLLPPVDGPDAENEADPAGA